jgi:hypothetical protein
LDEFDVLVDKNNDGTPEFVVFSADSGLVRTGDPNGLTEVFVADIKTGGLAASGYLAQSPTDSSTILLPVDASALGLTSSAGAFTYSVASFSTVYAGEGDEFTGFAAYNPWAKAIEDGDYVTVARNKTVKLSVAVNDANLTAQTPKGLMVVVYDNKSGAKEALLLGVR